MNNVPLINNLTVNDINTALIAIKKNLVKGANGNEQLQDVDVNVDVNIAQNCTYCAADSTTIKGAELFQGCSIKVLFTSAITGSNTTSPLTINYNNVDITVKVGKNGTLADFVAYNTGSGFVYCQAYTTLELLFDGNNFVIMGNPVVISNSDYVINTDGSITQPIWNYYKYGTSGYIEFDGVTTKNLHCVEGNLIVVKTTVDIIQNFWRGIYLGTYLENKSILGFQNTLPPIPANTMLLCIAKTLSTGDGYLDVICIL
jgi:hypothetical protein